MTGLVWTALGVLGTFAMTVVGDMVSEEVRDRLDHLPSAVLRLAARQLAAELRVSVYEGEWLPELAYILKGDEARPITRLYHGMRFALGILVSAGRISGRLEHRATAQVNAVPGKPLLTAELMLQILVKTETVSVGLDRADWPETLRAVAQSMAENRKADSYRGP